MLSTLTIETVVAIMHNGKAQYSNLSRKAPHQLITMWLWVDTDIKKCEEKNWQLHTVPNKRLMLAAIVAELSNKGIALESIKPKK